LVNKKSFPKQKIIGCEGRTIPGMGNSIGRYNRAVISVTGRLLSRQLYGFELQINNAPTFDMNAIDQWRIWTYENQQTEIVDGTYYSPRFNAAEEHGKLHIL
jgi:hypothetical protein